MSENDQRVVDLVDRLVPQRHDEPLDWDDVLERAGLAGSARGRRNGRRLALALVVAVLVILVSALAVGASQGWWFLRTGSAPKPIGGVDIVKTGSWDGKPWVLVAYGSATDGICFGITPGSLAKGTGEGAGLACARSPAVTATPETKPGALRITFLSGSGVNFPRYIVGPVVDTAQTVRITLTDGRVIETPTFAAPADLGAVRFYATPLPPENASTNAVSPRSDVSLLVGIGADGQEVARLKP